MTRIRVLKGLVASCLVLAPSAPPAAAQGPPPVAREFRAAWIATVANIDWPSRPGLTAEAQRAELARLLDIAARLNLNAVILQVRPACDALYDSRVEPWSEYLTGVMGQPPEPYYDPLEWAIDEAHQRGLQVHAWFNPYRARHSGAKSPASPDHVSRAQPEIVREYGKQLWLDPGDPRAEDHSVRVVMDVVTRYDVDGVHFDDYFYPYPIDDPEDEDSGALPFPDDASWAAYLESTPEAERLSRDDWRRQNVNHFIHRVATEVKAAKPWVLFGVSPFGIWRPGHPESVAGFDPYASLYADARLWLQEGWVDYFTPQLYWPVRSEGQSYPVLLNWWRQQNSLGRHLWPGNYTSRVGRGEERGWDAREVIEQIELTRGMRGARGNVHFSMKALAGDWGGLATALREGLYAEPALVPASPWLEGYDQQVEKPSASAERDGDALTVQWSATGDDDAAWQWVVQTKRAGKWRTRILPAKRRELTIESPRDLEAVAVAAVNRAGRQGPHRLVDLPRTAGRGRE